jgi:hypothetical protein
MEQIIKSLNELRAKDQNWDEHKELADIDLGEQDTSVNYLFREVREFLKKQPENDLEILRQYVGNDALYESLAETVKKSLWHFRAWEVVRNLEKNEGSRIQILFQNIMEKYVLRVDFEFQDTYGLYDIKDVDIFHRLLQSYDVLVAFYIRQHFSKRAIIDDIMEETDIIKEDAEIFAEILERYYRELQINFIMDELSKGNRN